MDKDDKDNYRGSHPSDLLPSGYSQDYMMNNPQPQPQISLDKLNFTDAMHFADYGPKVALNQSDISNENYYPRFDALSDSLQEEPLIAPPLALTAALEEDGNTSSMQYLGNVQKAGATEAKNRRKRPRSLKTSDEVESQRKTHIAVERNRRRQMNEHLRMLRSLMPGSYVQRGDQASIIGGAIEFVRELEQLLMCLESQKRRRLSSGSDVPPNATVDPTPLPIYQPYFPLPLQDAGDQVKLLDFDPSGLSREEIAENKSCIADIEVRLLGLDAMIKIMSRRRPGQLLKTITALEDLGFNILHTNITTMDQTVLYSFNVKITGETIWTAEEIANSVRQILGFIDASTI